MTDIERRFMAKVSVTSGCWLWTGAKTKFGYGVFRLNGRQINAHRAALILLHGANLDGDDCVCHACDTPECVNPRHLWVGTQKDNIRDMHAKGRDYNGHDLITHCPAGHAYGPENTRTYRGKRVCRQCDRDRNKGNDARKAAARQRSAKAGRGNI